MRKNIPSWRRVNEYMNLEFVKGKRGGFDLEMDSMHGLVKTKYKSI